MVDIHSHILPCLDDGSRSLAESVEMLRIAALSGTTDIVATPHANLEYSFDPEVVSAKIVELTQAAGPVPRIHRGCDFHLSYDNIQDAIAHPTKYTINHQNYLLVEFSDLIIFKNTGEIFRRLMEAGMTPIITHPERNWLLQQRVELLEEWAVDGILLQVTAQSFLGRFGRHARQFGDALMRRGLVHFVASDAHDREDRTPELAGAYHYMERTYGGDWAEQLFVTNPRRALTGEPILPVAPDEFSKPRKWYKFWG